MSVFSFRTLLGNRTCCSRQSRKRSGTPLGALPQPENLETRQLLTTFQGPEIALTAVEACSAVAGDDVSQRHGGGQVKQLRSHQTPVYPDITGMWTLHAVADIEDDPPLDFTGHVLLSQKGRKATGNVELEGLPTFRIKGKLDKTDTFHLKGSTRFPVETREDHFYFLRGRLNVDFASDLATFTGQVHRVIFGYHIDVALTATKE